MRVVSSGAVRDAQLGVLSVTLPRSVTCVARARAAVMEAAVARLGVSGAGRRDRAAVVVRGCSGQGWSPTLSSLRRIRGGRVHCRRRHPDVVGTRPMTTAAVVRRMSMPPAVR
ncbi:hypothetical protein GCM10023205_24810 [Yinghuangia aomiensis]|uniref:Uncharacterized protein n=1 Tax=Yinghuangia aomiensis TaxID=676205 RepID=A0ABP9H2H3_9ACTN